ncbi:MAG: trypsin-like peptidase domain-containing protein, partial [Planctomycetia bacterium]|nr:trypsin-like peptidase domain-containing protein [Planctomycetia bacterium]
TEEKPEKEAEKSTEDETEKVSEEAESVLVMEPTKQVVTPVVKKNVTESSKMAPSVSELDLREDAIVRAIRTARPAVVNIRGEKVMKPVSYDATGAPVSSPAASASQDPQHVNGMGTGILFDSRGYIVTNFHVVDGIQEIHVTTADTKTYVAEIIACDRETDLAIIKIDALAGEVFETIQLGDSNDLMTGETVITVGNAFGYEHTVTKGIVSALHRSVQVSDVQFYQDLIQTDASINPGNSGGPLLNIHGKMIGINVAVRAGAQGIGFAIPTNRAMEIVTKMVESMNAEKNWHGIHFASFPLTRGQGAVVREVEKNSPAESIGLRAGDVILAVNQRKIGHELDFACAITEMKAGETIRISVSRNNKTANVRLAMGAVSVKNRQVSAYTPKVKGRPAFQPEKLTSEEIIWKQLGVLVSPVTGNSIPVQGARKYNGGLLVQNIRANSPAARQGIQNGDILLGILRWETLTIDNVLFVLNQPELQQQAQVKFLLARNGKVLMGHFAAQDFPGEKVVGTAMKYEASSRR